jgi:polyhydroxybutyrate depolymerase
MKLTSLRLFLTTIILFFAIGALKAQYLEFEHNDQIREYIYYSPPNIQMGAPLVFVLHGYTGDASSIESYAGMNAIADQYGFAVCYPRGTVDFRGNRFWNVGYDFHKGVIVDDVDYLIQLASYLQNQHKLSSQNTFVTGMSNGGEMCYLLACESPSTFKAIAPVAGMMLQSFFKNCDSTIPVSIFEIHGTNDNVNRFNGDIAGKDGWGAYPDIPFTIKYWVKSNGCTSTQIDTLPNINTKDSSYVISEKHLNGTNESQVWLYKIINGGHDWPGESGNKDFETSRQIWLFFSAFLTE